MERAKETWLVGLEGARGDRASDTQMRSTGGTEYRAKGSCLAVGAF